MKKAWKNIVLTAMGSILMAFSMTLFLLPNKIAPGGFSGLSTVLHYLFGWPAGTVILLMDMPLFALALKRYCVKYVVYSLYSVFVTSLLIDLVPVPLFTHDPLLAGIFGGVLMGAGLGMVILAGSNTGGTALLGQFIHSSMPHINLAWIIFAIDCLVVTFSAIVFSVELALYAFVSLYISSKVMDLMLEGLSGAKTIYIISERSEEIAQEVLYTLQRGMTRLSATGMYSKKGKYVLMVVMKSAREVVSLKQIVQKIDPEAFAFVVDAREVVGEGFAPPPVH